MVQRKSCALKLAKSVINIEYFNYVYNKPFYTKPSIPIPILKFNFNNADGPSMYTLSTYSLYQIKVSGAKIAQLVGQAI